MFQKEVAASGGRCASLHDTPQTHIMLEMLKYYN
jgi:hypothetical protein